MFVFDGATPSLKRKTIIARRRQRGKRQRDFRKAAERLLRRASLSSLSETQDGPPGAGTTDAELSSGEERDDVEWLPPEPQPEREECAGNKGEWLEEHRKLQSALDETGIDMAVFASLPEDLKREILAETSPISSAPLPRRQQRAMISPPLSLKTINNQTDLNMWL